MFGVGCVVSVVSCGVSDYGCVMFSSRCGSYTCMQQVLLLQSNYRLQIMFITYTKMQCNARILNVMREITPIALHARSPLRDEFAPPPILPLRLVLWTPASAIVVVRIASSRGRVAIVGTGVAWRVAWSTVLRVLVVCWLLGLRWVVGFLGARGGCRCCPAVLGAWWWLLILGELGWWDG